MPRPPEPDLLFETDDGEIVAAVEVKAVAADFDAARRQALAGAAAAGAELAVLLTKDRLIVWDRGGGLVEDADVSAVLDPFFRGTGVRASVMGGGAFEMLSSLIFRVLADEDPASWGEAYAGTGAALRANFPRLADAIRGTRVWVPRLELNGWAESTGAAA